MGLWCHGNVSQTARPCVRRAESWVGSLDGSVTRYAPKLMHMPTASWARTVSHLPATHSPPPFVVSLLNGLRGRNHARVHVAH